MAGFASVLYGALVYLFFFVTFLYAIAFFATLLGNILFLTRVWGYSTLRAGLAFTPGPLVVAALSARMGRLASRIGFRQPQILGGRINERRVRHGRQTAKGA